MWGKGATVAPEGSYKRCFDTGDMLAIESKTGPRFGKPGRLGLLAHGSLSCKLAKEVLTNPKP